MESILSLIIKSQSHLPGADAQLLQQMTPLVLKYSYKLHFMEREDAVQELYLALLEALPYLNPANGEGKCLSYMKTTIIHRYCALCKTYLSRPPSENLDSYSFSLEALPVIDDSYYDVVSYINSFAPECLKFKILSKCFFEDKTAKEISQELQISRQYVNRIKKQLILDYFAQK